MVQSTGRSTIHEAQEQIRTLLRQRHHIQPAQEDDFTLRNLEEVFAAQETSARVMAWLLAVIASVSLVVGGIGIMNIMLVSVTERTHEIGLRQAVGATTGDILLQFLIEAVSISLVGGIAGIGLGVITSILDLSIRAMVSGVERGIDHPGVLSFPDCWRSFRLLSGSQSRISRPDRCAALRMSIGVSLAPKQPLGTFGVGSSALRKGK